MLGLAEGPGLAALRPAGFGMSGAAQTHIASAADMCKIDALPLKHNQMQATFELCYERNESEQERVTVKFWQNLLKI